MYLNRERRLIYLANPRTASVATAEALVAVGFRQMGDHHAGLESHGLVQLDHKSPAFDEICSDTYWKAAGHRVFTAVRNPWDTCVSWMFHLKVPEPWSVEDFQHHLVEKAASGHLAGGKLFRHAAVADDVVRFERLFWGLQAVLEDSPGAKEWEWKSLTLPRRNVSTAREGRPYQEFYAPTSQQWVTDTFGEEIEEYGCEF